jgi:glycerate dehydrogenase
MKVIIAQSLRDMNSHQAGRLPLDEVLQTSDAISLHCPLTEQTRNLITKREFALMKPTSIIINAARGGIINERDLLEALHGGQIAGAGVDCLEHEPPASDDPMINAGLSQLIITPHNAWGTIQARQRLVDGTLENIQLYLQGVFPNRVN